MILTYVIIQWSVTIVGKISKPILDKILHKSMFYKFNCLWHTGKSVTDLCEYNFRLVLLNKSVPLIPFRCLQNLSFSNTD